MADQNTSTQLKPIFPYAGRSTTEGKIDRQFQRVVDIATQPSTPATPGTPTRSIDETVDDVVKDTKFTEAVKGIADVAVENIDFSKLSDIQVKDLKAKLGI